MTKDSIHATNLRVFALSALIWLCGFSSAALGAAEPIAGPPLLHGVGVHGPMTWGRTTLDRTGYLAPVYGDTRYAMPVNLLRQVKSAGFDFVRLSVDPGPFLALSGKERDQLDQLLLDNISKIRSAGLDVLVDFHPIGMVKKYAESELVAEGEDSLFPAYEAMIHRTVRLLTKLDVTHIAIEPMNEPALGWSSTSSALWQTMMQHLHDDVRAESPTMTVVLTGAQGGNIEGLKNLDPEPFLNSNVRFSYHYYLPYLFTHQGVVSSISKLARLWPYVSDLPYPAKPEQREAFSEVVEKRINGDLKIIPEEKPVLIKFAQAELKKYFEKGGTREAIASDFDKVKQWADAHRIPAERIFLGEFGVTQRGPGSRGAMPLYRAHWLHDVSEEAKKLGFHWSLWALSGDSGVGMVLTNMVDQSRLDVTTLQSLGMRAPMP